jgi:pimeloyl-ACP methyl ester carboxylesterase
VNPTSRRIALPTGLTYHVLEWGADDPTADHTVYLIHGFLDFGWTWAEMVTAYSRAVAGAGRTHFVAPDMRGHGDSDRVGTGGYYYFPDYIADLHGLIEKTARARVSLVGHSMGGTIASYYAGTFPARIGKLALLEGLGPPEGEPAGPRRTGAWIDAWARARTRGQHSYASIAEAAERMQVSDPLASREQLLRLAEKGTLQLADGRYRFKHDALHVTQGPVPFEVAVASRYWRAVTADVVLVDGAESLFRLAESELAARSRNFARCRHAVIPGAAHAIMRHQPAALADLLREFLA